MERMKCCWSNGLRAITFLAITLGGKCALAQVGEQTPAVHDTLAKLAAVRVVSEDGKVLLSEPPGLAVHAGQPLQPREVAASIRTLYQTGDYADIRAVTYPEGDAIRLDFVARENLYFSQILINGLKPPPTEASAVASMQLSLGQTYRENDVRDAIDRLKETLRDEGLYQAKVKAAERPHPETHQLDVVVTLDPGPRVHAKKINLTNNTEYSDLDILARFKLRPGSELTIGRVQSGLQRIRKFLEKKGHLSASVSARRGDYDPSDNTIPVNLDVSEGPRVQ